MVGFRLLVISLFFVLFTALPVKAEVDAPFDKLQWKGRALIITGSFDHPYLEPQLEMLEAVHEGIIERDLIIVRFKDDHVKTIEELSAFPFQVPDMYWDGKEADDNRQYLEHLLGTDDDIFSVVLVGKDGAVKKVWKEESLEGPVSPAEIFGVIDEMPMRIQEMKENNR